MPLNVPDYLADTAHLNAAQSGAYLHLIMHYWQTGGLPDDAVSLQRISKMTPYEWKKNFETIQKFFHDGWKHKRIDSELQKSNEISDKRRKAAQQKHSKSTAKADANAPANAEQLHTHARTCAPASPSHKKDSVSPRGDTADVVGEDPRAQLFRLGKTILVSFGIEEKRTGALVGQWLKARNDPIGLLAAIQFARDQNVAEPIAYISAIVHGKGHANGKDRQDLGSMAKAIAAEMRQRESAQGDGGSFDFGRSSREG